MNTPVPLFSLGPAGRLVAVLAPHPDDFDAIGVTLRRLQAAGCELRVAVLCPAWSGVQDSFCDPPTPARKAEVREAEQRASCAFFGLAPECLAFLRLEEDATGVVAELPANRARVWEYLRATAPDWLFLAHPNDTNADHRRATGWVLEMLPALARPVTAFLVRDPKTVEMRTDAYTAFGEEDARWKAELLRCHRSQHQRNLNTRGHGFDERILAVNRAIAADLSLAEPYAEAFERRWLT